MYSRLLGRPFRCQESEGFSGDKWAGLKAEAIFAQLLKYDGFVVSFFKYLKLS